MQVSREDMRFLEAIATLEGEELTLPQASARLGMGREAMLYRLRVLGLRPIGMFGTRATIGGQTVRELLDQGVITEETAEPAEVAA